MRKFIIQNTLLKFKILILLVSPSIAFAAVQPLEQVNGGLGGGGGGQIVSDVTIELPDHAQQGDLLENIAVQITSSIRPTRLQITLKSEEEDLAPIEACSVETLTGNGTYNGTCNISLPLLSPSTRYKAEARIEIGAQVEYEKELGDNSSLFLNVNPLNCSRDDYHCISIPENRSPGEAPASLSETIGTSNITSECEDQIKAALSSASPGHTVFIEAGVCQVSQGFKIIKPNLRIVGREGAYRTILEATGTGYLLSIHGDGTKIQGLTLKKGAGIQVSDYIGTLTIQNMRFEDHLGQYDQGGAAINDRGKVGQYLRIIGSHFVENRASGSGAAVALTSPARFSLHDNLFLANLSENGSGGALSVSYSQALKLYSNQFVLNSAHSGGAISVIYSGTVLSRENIFLRNSASNSAGAINALEISRFTSDQDYLVENSAATFSTLNIDIAEYARIRRAIIVNNQGNGAVFLRGTSSEITDNLINMNSYADFGNPAVTMVSSTRAIVTHNSFKDNSGGGALNIFTAPSTVIESNRFVNNRGGQVYLDDMYYFPAFDLFIQASLDNSSRIAYNNFIQSEPESARHTFIYLGSHEFPRQLVMANIFSDTDYGDALALDCASGSPELVSHSLQWGASVSTNCGPQHDQAINADPQFRNDGEYYRLQSTSPAIGEGPGSANIGVWQGE